MTIRKVLSYPHPILRKMSKSVASMDVETSALITDLFDTMYAVGTTVGMAANQIGATQRIFVIDVSSERTQPLCMVNPEIIYREGRELMQEGCASFADIYVSVWRAPNVLVKALDADGTEFELEAEGLMAQCIQHELDHLDGKVMIDYLSPLKQKMLHRRMEKMRKRAEKG